MAKITPQADPQHGIPCARSSHGVSYANHRLIVYGGEHVARTPLSDEQALWVCEDDDGDNNNNNNELKQWRCIPASRTTNNSPSPRIAHAQAVHGTDLYVFGGRAGITMQEQAMNDLWKFDTATEMWHEIPADAQGTIPPVRSFHRMICVQDSLYVFGGCGMAGRLSDLYQFHIPTQTWSACPVSQLKGRGGPNLLSLAKGKLFDIQQQQWLEQGVVTLEEMRPRSVCVSGSFPALGVAVIFGGEVDPSDLGHEGAGGFAGDLVLLDEATGAFRECISAAGEETNWPETRGWSAGDVHQNALYVFGGLSGDDTNPRRLNDLWKLELVGAVDTAGEGEE